VRTFLLTAKVENVAEANTSGLRQLGEDRAGKERHEDNESQDQLKWLINVACLSYFNITMSSSTQLKTIQIHRLKPCLTSFFNDRYRGFGSSPQSCKFKIEVTCSAAVFFKAPSYLDSMVSDIYLRNSFVLCLFAPVAALIQISITFANVSHIIFAMPWLFISVLARSREQLAP
jgi:hypothetical protein